MNEKVTPIFILGSPRSGTTLISSYLGTAPEISNFGELGIFYFANYVSRYEYRRTRMPLLAEYISEIEDHAVEFSQRKARERNAKFFCDSKPFNLRIIDFLVDKFPNAIFILMLRHYSGVIQSLERSYRDGYKWAGNTNEKRAAVWSEIYSYAKELPIERTIPFSYDKLCFDPNNSISNFLKRLDSLGVPIDNLTKDVFLLSHATTTPRKTIGKKDLIGHIILRSIPSYNSYTWSQEIDDQIKPIIRETNQSLLQLFPGDYQNPIGWYLS